MFRLNWNTSRTYAVKSQKYNEYYSSDSPVVYIGCLSYLHDLSINGYFHTVVIISLPKRPLFNQSINSSTLVLRDTV